MKTLKEDPDCESRFVLRRSREGAKYKHQPQHASKPMQIMKIHRNLWLALSMALLLAIPSIGRSQYNQVPAAINYQGRLTDMQTDPLPSGYYEIEFRIWDDAASSQPADLIWGRTFPVHVVTNGLFNILLTDGGGSVNSPTTPTNTLLSAFGASAPSGMVSRYLGLTITVSNYVTVPVSEQKEISPRQQLASAPFAIQAQTAFGVVGSVVSTANLMAFAVTTDKIASNNVTSGSLAEGAVTTTKIADNAVTTAKITNSAVTVAKLNIDGDIHLNDHTIYLRGSSDTNHGLTWTNSFGGQSLDGPVLFGYEAGVLGTSTSGIQKAALTWKSDQSVTANGSLTATNGAVSIFGALQPNVAKNVPHTATTDGFVIVTALNRFIRFQLWPVGASTNSTTSIDQTEYHNVAGANTFTMAMPVAKGETWQLTDINNFTTSTYLNIYWRPLGK
jgi:hypothetical protein